MNTKQRRLRIGIVLIAATVLAGPIVPAVATESGFGNQDYGGVVFEEFEGRQSILIDHSGVYLLFGRPKVPPPNHPPPSLAISRGFACHADWSLSQLSSVIDGFGRDIFYAFVRVHRVHSPVVVEYRFDWGGPYVHGFDGKEIPPRPEATEEPRTLAPRARPASCPNDEPPGAIPPSPVLSRAEALGATRRLAVFARRVDRLEAKLVPWVEFDDAHEVFRGSFTDEEGLAWVVVLGGKFEPEYPTAPLPSWQVFAFHPAAALRLSASGGEREWPYISSAEVEKWPAWFDRLRDRSRQDDGPVTA